MNSLVPSNLITDTYRPFHLNAYWDDIYKSTDIDKFTDWYFDLISYKSKEFDISTWDKNSEIIIIGVGNSKLIDFLISNKFVHVTLVDFSLVLINYLKRKYENLQECSEWDCKCIILH